MGFRRDAMRAATLCLLYIAAVKTQNITGIMPVYTFPNGTATLYREPGIQCDTGADPQHPNCGGTAAALNNIGRSGSIAGEYMPPYTSVTDRNLERLCFAQWTSQYDNYKATGSVTNGISNSDLFYVDWWHFTASSPCCQACYLTGDSTNPSGGNVQVFYWPTPAPNPKITAYVDANNFTFTSPSNYVAFRSLGATDLCGAIGTMQHDTTIAFAPGALYTSMATTNLDPGFDMGPTTYAWTAFKGADFTNVNCTNITVQFWSIPGDTNTYSTWVVGASEEMGVTYTYNPCSPTLSVPSEIFAINTAWATCLQGISAFYDPPFALQEASGLSPASLTTSQQGKFSIKATTGPVPSLPTPSPTTTAGPLTTSIASYQPSSNLLTKSPPASKAPGDPGFILESATVSADPVISAPADPGTSIAPASPNSQALTIPNGQDPEGGNNGASVATTEPALPIIPLSSKGYTRNSASQYVNGFGHTLIPGNSVIIAGSQQVSLDPSASAVVYGGLTTDPMSSAAASQGLKTSAEVTNPPVVNTQKHTGAVVASPGGISVAYNSPIPLSVGNDPQSATVQYPQNLKSTLFDATKTSPIPSDGGQSRDTSVTKIISINGEAITHIPDSSTKNGAQAALPIITVANHLITLVSGSSLMAVAGTLIKPGSPAVTISGMPVSADLSSNLIIGTSTFHVPSLPTPNDAASALATVANQIITRILSSSLLAVAGTPVTPGNAPITISGTPVFVDLSSNLIVGSSTIRISALSTPVDTASALATVADQRITLVRGSSLVAIAGTPITPGNAPITISGTPISVDLSSNLIIGTSTLHIPPASSPITIGSKTFSIDANGLVIAGITLTPGGPGITVSGSFISLGNSVLISGSQTVILSPPKTTSKGGIIAGAILSAFGGRVGGSVSVPVSTSTAVESNATAFGGAVRESGVPMLEIAIGVLMALMGSFGNFM